MVSLTQFVVWIIVGLLGGSIAGLIVRRERRGFGIWRNLGVGLLGALIGGLLFWLLGLFPGLDAVRISLRDIVAAIVGSFIVLLALWLWQRWKKSP
ncbi:MAG: GlsB/YeaQ/YmgE family stress response membrane protein [Alphaproteobacteria bacterium]|nr:GlsB/YeaQ/YmgE family stress response membrane protein [Alphaproteobacteria bacterium]